MWETPNNSETVAVGVSVDVESLIKKLQQIADTKAREYVEMCGYIQEKRDEMSYEATNGCGKHVGFRITEHQMDLPEEAMGAISREMEKNDRASDVEAYLGMLYESESIEPWKYEYMTRKPEVTQEILRVLDEVESRDTPFNTSLDIVMENVIGGIALDDDKLAYLWEEFRNDVMVDDDGRILDDFLGFDYLTEQKEVWRWFDERYTGGLARLMSRDNEPNTK